MRNPNRDYRPKQDTRSEEEADREFRRNYNGPGERDKVMTFTKGPRNIRTIFPEGYVPDEHRKILQRYQLRRLLRKPYNIEVEILAFFSFVSFFAGMFFLSPILTGNVVLNLSKTNSNFIGIVLFVIGIIGIMFSFEEM